MRTVRRRAFANHRRLLWYTYNPFYRLTGVTYPDAGQEKVTYSDAGPTPSVTASTLLTAGNWMSKETIYDAFGHPTKTELTSDPDDPDYTQTTYDGLAHVWTVTNPYRRPSDPTYGVPPSTTTPWIGLQPLIA